MADLTPLLTEHPSHKPVCIASPEYVEGPAADASMSLPHDVHYALHEAECILGMPGGTPQGTLGHDLDFWRMIPLPVTANGAVEVRPFLATCKECGAVAVVIAHRVTMVGHVAGLHPMTPGFFGTAFITRCEWSE